MRTFQLGRKILLNSTKYEPIFRSILLKKNKVGKRQNFFAEIDLVL